jgi:DNA-directed RNA polymerase specialized sigma24 family protein
MTRAPKEETAEMLALRRSGLTYKQIADRYGLTGRTVAQRLGLKPTRCASNIYPRPRESGYRTL